MLLIISISIFLILLFKLISIYNLGKLYPTSEEIIQLKQRLGNISIKNEADLIKIQNKTFDQIAFMASGRNEYSNVELDFLFKSRKAVCYERSILLQKIMLYNNLDVVPIFLYFDPTDPLATSIFDFFRKNIHSHNVFEVEINNKKVLVRTNSRIKRIQTLEQYLGNGPMPKGTKYIRHLNNRNGYFISPSLIPDIY